MKPKHMLKIPTLLIAIFLANCSTIQITPDQFSSDTAILIDAGLRRIKPPARQQAVRDQAYAVAVGIRSFEGGRVPTPEEVRAMIAQFTSKSEEWAELGNIVVTGLTIALSHANGNTQTAFIWLEAGAKAVERGACPNCPLPYGTPQHFPTPSASFGPLPSPHPVESPRP